MNFTNIYRKFGYIIYLPYQQHNVLVQPFKNYSSQSHAKNSTVDIQEVNTFENFTNFWWDENGELKPLHSMNKLRVPFIRDGLKNNGKLNPEYKETSKPLTNISILEVGCGGGILSEPLARLGAKVVGIDAVEAAIKCAQEHASRDLRIKDNITYIHSSIEDLQDKCKEKFDAVVASEVIEHVSAKDLFISSCVQVVKPGGSLFFSTINKTALAWLLDIIAAEYILNIVPRGTHQWDKFISHNNLQKLLEKYECRTKIIHGMIYTPIINRWCWIPDTSLNYFLHAVKSEAK